MHMSKLSSAETSVHGQDMSLFKIYRHKDIDNNLKRETIKS